MDTTGYTYTVTPFNAGAMKYELENMVLEAGGNILYHSRLAQVEVRNELIKSVTICNKSGVTNYEAYSYIDATGDGDLSSWAGVPCINGRLSDGLSQPMTLNVKMCNVDTQAIKNYLRKNKDLYGNSVQLIDRSSRLSIGGFKEIVRQGKTDGMLKNNKKGTILLFETDQLGEVIINSTRVLGCDSTNPESLTQAEITARKEAMELVKFLKNYMPGFNNAHLEFTGPSIGIRSSRQIIGHYILTAEDLLERRNFEDIICHSAYPIDVHNPEGEGGWSKHMNNGSYYGIPFRILTNNYIGNLVTVGRCVSATFEAQAAIRVSPTAGAIGQAGGIAASMYSKEKIRKMCDIDVNRLQTLIQKQNGFLDLSRVKKSICN